MTAELPTRAPAEWRLDGRVALVSGGDLGIGHAIALALGAAGASVALLARNEAPQEGGTPTHELLVASGRWRRSTSLPTSPTPNPLPKPSPGPLIRSAGYTSS